MYLQVDEQNSSELKIDKDDSMKFQRHNSFRIDSFKVVFRRKLFSNYKYFLQSSHMMDGFGKTHFSIPMSGVLLKTNIL